MLYDMFLLIKPKFLQWIIQSWDVSRSPQCSLQRAIADFSSFCKQQRFIAFSNRNFYFAPKYVLQRAVVYFSSYSIRQRSIEYLYRNNTLCHTQKYILDRASVYVSNYSIKQNSICYRTEKLHILKRVWWGNGLLRLILI